MAKTIKDIDYLAISARIRAMETSLLTREKMEQILEVRTNDEAVKLLQECGYPELDISRPEAMDAALSAARKAMLEDLGDSAPDAGYIDIFKLKYDYHNVKSILKAAVMNTSPDRMLMDMGRVPAQELKEAVREGAMEQLPEQLGEAVVEAKDVLDTTRDPQLSDLVLDRWYYREMTSIAEKTGSAFLKGYVQAQIDAANLKAMVRTFRMGKSAEFLKGVLLEGGEVDPDAILAANGNDRALAELYSVTRFSAAAQAGAEALQGGELTTFEKLCDDAVNDYLSMAQLIPFGEAPLLGYLAARETEYTNLRILLLGRSAGIPADVIRARLRASYV